MLTEEKPKVIEDLGNNYYYYNYDIKSIETLETDENGVSVIKVKYDYTPYKIYGYPTFPKCLQTVIKDNFTVEERMLIYETYMQYNLGIIDTYDEQYENYLNKLNDIKNKIGEDFNHRISNNNTSKTRQIDVFKFIKNIVNTTTLNDNTSLSVKTLFPKWEEVIGQSLQKDFKLLYDNKLYKVIQQHTAQKDWIPSELPALYGLITKRNSGTIEDPIVYERNMILEKGKYYIQNDTLYKCITDSIVGYDTDLVDLLSLLEIVQY